MVILFYSFFSLKYDMYRVKEPFLVLFFLKNSSVPNVLSSHLPIIFCFQHHSHLHGNKLYCHQQLYKAFTTTPRTLHNDYHFQYVLKYKLKDWVTRESCKQLPQRSEVFNSQPGQKFIPFQLLGERGLD